MSSLRRLAKDHAALRASLPPNYLFPPSEDADSIPDDLTQLLVHLTGSEGTPYCSGLWLLHLRIPHDYPKSPPKATFKTRIFHPNVEESTGTVCLETLKRDWDPRLTLKDILITISCLLIQPNPDSALNEKAGVLVREDYDGFMRQARLMTKIHAPIPNTLKELVNEARRRGEDQDSQNKSAKNHNKLTSSSSISPQILSDTGKIAITELCSGDESADSAKENNPSQPVRKARGDGASLQKHILGKRPLRDLAVTPESEDNTVLLPDQKTLESEEGDRPRKSPKHTHQSQANGREATLEALSDGQDPIVPKVQDRAGSIASSTTSSQSSSRKAAVSSKYRPYARIGIKRL